MRISALSLVYSTAEYCATVWCRSTHTRLIDSILNDALRIVTGCLRPTSTEDLPVLAGIQPAELRRLETTLSLAYRDIHDPYHVLHGQLAGQQDAHLGRLRSRRPFVAAAWKLLDSLSKLNIRVKKWTNHEWNADYLESTSGVCAFIPRVSSRPLGKSLPRASWVRLNRLGTAEDVFTRPCTNDHHRIANVAPLSKLQITSYLLISYSMYHEACRFWMMQLDVG